MLKRKINGDSDIIRRCVMEGRIKRVDSFRTNKGICFGIE